MWPFSFLAGFAVIAETCWDTPEILQEYWHLGSFFLFQATQGTKSPVRVRKEELHWAKEALGTEGETISQEPKSFYCCIEFWFLILSWRSSLSFRERGLVESHVVRLLLQVFST